MSSGGVDEDEFSILLGRDGEFGLVDGGNAVTNRNPLPVDEDHALGRSEIGVPESSRRVGKRGSGKKRGAQDPRIGADQECIGIVRITACQLDEASGTIHIGEFSLSQRGSPPRSRGRSHIWKSLRGS